MNLGQGNLKVKTPLADAWVALPRLPDPRSRPAPIPETKRHDKEFPFIITSIDRTFTYHGVNTYGIRVKSWNGTERLAFF